LIVKINQNRHTKQTKSVKFLLNFYASSLKQIVVVGNIVVAALLAFSVIIIGIFDIVPNTFDINREQMGLAFSILFDYAKFAFLISLVREIIKDIEDINGDNSQGIRTLPIIIGTKKTAMIAFVLLLIPTLYLFYYINDNLFANNLYYSIFYLLALVIAPMIFCLIKIVNAKEKSDFHFVESLVVISSIVKFLFINFILFSNGYDLYTAKESAIFLY
jgi:4-hydroxybenzoate polyprenyltransferase